MSKKKNKPNRKSTFSTARVTRQIKNKNKKKSQVGTRVVAFFKSVGTETAEICTKVKEVTLSGCTSLSEKITEFRDIRDQSVIEEVQSLDRLLTAERVNHRNALLQIAEQCTNLAKQL